MINGRDDNAQLALAIKMKKAALLLSP